MTEERLSENPEEWPTCPFELLGVPRDADQRTIRLAYVRLIHYFKPERAPEEFRRIREAYEAIREEPRRRSRGLEMPFDIASTRSSSQPLRHVSLTPEFPLPAVESSSLAIDEAWQAAITGAPERAFQQLLDLQVSHPEREEIAARLYWLSRMQPHCAGGKDPLDLLYPAIVRNGLRGLPADLLLREMARRRDAAKSIRWSGLLEDSRNAGRLRPLLRIRWGSALRAQTWALIREDLEILERRYSFNPLPWLQGCVDAVRVCLANPGAGATELIATCFDSLNENLDGSASLQELDQEFDEIEELYAEAHLQLDWWELEGQQPPVPLEVWRELPAIQMADHLDMFAFRSLLEPMLLDWSSDPVVALRRLDEMILYYPRHASRLCALTGECFQRFPPANSADANGAELKKLVLQDLWAGHRLRVPTRDVEPAAFRRGVLRFCVEERVDLERVALVLHQVMPNLPWNSAFHPLRLEADDALQTVIRGCLALWDEPAAVLS